MFACRRPSDHKSCETLRARIATVQRRDFLSALVSAVHLLTSETVGSAKNPRTTTSMRPVFAPEGSLDCEAVSLWPRRTAHDGERRGHGDHSRGDAGLWVLRATQKSPRPSSTHSIESHAQAFFPGPGWPGGPPGRSGMYPPKTPANQVQSLSFGFLTNKLEEKLIFLSASLPHAKRCFCGALDTTCFRRIPSAACDRYVALDSRRRMRLKSWQGLF